MCGIVGIFSHQRVAEELYNSLIHLQHRGQDSAGLLTCQQRFDIKHGLGLVREVFKDKELLAMQGNIGIGHTRYRTSGGYAISDVQPMWIGSPRGMALAHNGNLVNYRQLAVDLREKQHRYLHSSTDSEVILHLLSDGIHHSSHHTADADFFTTLCHAVKGVFDRAEGSYSIVSTILGKGLVAFRDPHGFRPLVMGKRVNADGTIDYIIASETTMFYSLGFTSIDEVQPGEVVFINREGELHRQIVNQKQFSPCIFEYVYFSRPDSIQNGVSVYNARLNMGENLARRWKEKFPGILPDVVIPAPFTSNTAAQAFAMELGVRYAEGLYKNPFIGRTFIMPEGEDRRRKVRYKLTPQRKEIENKNVLILDDSIVRGTTSVEVVKMIREYHAKAVYFVSACPPIIEPCYYGIDIPTREELIAPQYSQEELRQLLNVDQLLYQELDDLVEAITREGHHAIKTPCMACLNGCYPTRQTKSEIRHQGEVCEY